MLDAIEQNYNDLKINNLWTALSDIKNSPFIFHKHELINIALPDDLYIKMNSRGKALSDFEYVKACFGPLIKNSADKIKFENSIDQEWSKFVWCYAKETDKIDDLALYSDSCFIRLLNYITDIIAFNNNILFTNVKGSIEQLETIYSDQNNLHFLFNTLDTLTNLSRTNQLFWKNHFYYEGDQFYTNKVRLYFSHQDIDFCSRCLKHYNREEGKQNQFGLPEQFLFYATILHLQHSTPDFPNRVRIIRNLVANSENEMRMDIMRDLLSQVEDIVMNGNLLTVSEFKTDQIEEEGVKQTLLKLKPGLKSIINKVEDHPLLRGCLSVFDLNSNRLSIHAQEFLKLFNNDNDLNEIGNALLVYGDYRQTPDDKLYNLANHSKGTWRKFITTPGFNKVTFNKTRTVLLKMLDDLNVNPGKTSGSVIVEKLNYFESNPKTWEYYFLKYPIFRSDCNQGFYYWYDSKYEFIKMKEKQFNGAYWSPFLLQIINKIQSGQLYMDEKETNMILNVS